VQFALLADPKWEKEIAALDTPLGKLTYKFEASVEGVKLEPSADGYSIIVNGKPLLHVSITWALSQLKDVLGMVELAGFELNGKQHESYTGSDGQSWSISVDPRGGSTTISRTSGDETIAWTLDATPGHFGPSVSAEFSVDRTVPQPSPSPPITVGFSAVLTPKVVPAPVRTKPSPPTVPVGVPVLVPERSPVTILELLEALG